ncbi:hypothetical protein [Salegentibacter sp. F14]
MKILFPLSKHEYHPYLEEILIHSKEEIVFGKIQKYDASIDIVNIHWPETFYNWNEPTAKELQALIPQLEKWKRTATIVYTKHDLRRSKGETPNFSKLFDIVESLTDVFIHLGLHSRKLYEEKFPDKVHEIVYHPLLKDVFKKTSKYVAREKLGIDQKSLVILAPGKIRTDEERKLVLKSFNSIKRRNKVLISTHMRTELKIELPGRVRMKKFFDFQSYFKMKFKQKHSPPKYIFTYKSLSSEDLALKVSAADIILIPRIDLLNSGSVFLGFTFDKIIIGPDVGNIGPQLKEVGMPVFNPLSLSSVKSALNKAIEMLKRHNADSEYIEKYQPKAIAMNYSKVLSKYLKN